MALEHITVLDLTHMLSGPYGTMLLADLGARALLDALPMIVAGDTPVPQPEAGVTYAAKVTREEAQIDWTDDAATLERRLRAFTPWPGLFFTHQGERFKVIAATTAASDDRQPGVLLDDAVVTCGHGTALRLLRLQREGKPAAAAGDVLRGVQGLRTGDALGDALGDTLAQTLSRADG